MATYGEHLLAGFESKRRARAARRRGLTLGVPAVAASMWSLADLIGARHDRLVEAGAGGFRQAIDPFLPTIWTVLFVMLPVIAAVKPVALPAGAGLAFVAGPVLTPTLFGSGGWHAWQIAVIAALTVLVVGAAIERARRLPPD